MKVLLRTEKYTNNKRIEKNNSPLSFQNFQNAAQKSDVFIKSSPISFQGAKAVFTKPKVVLTNSAFIENMRELVINSGNVNIDYRRINQLAKFINDTPPKLPNWSCYIGNKKDFDVNKSMFELGIFIGQQGGTIIKAPFEQGIKWKFREKTGSSAAAEIVKQLKQKKMLPGIDITNPAQIDENFLPHDVPFKNKRLAILKEFAQPKAFEKLSTILDKAKVNNKNYYFTFEHVQELAEAFPESFGGDKMYKKAIVLINAMEGLTQNRGIKVKLDTPVAADYRLPQALEGFGVLKFNNNIKDEIKQGTCFNQDDKAVAEIRAATIVASDRLTKLTGYSSAQIDNWLWNIAQPYYSKKALEGLEYRPMKNHIMVQTMTF